MRRSVAVTVLALMSAAASAPGAAAEGMTCFGSRSHGVSCLTADGWKLFNRANGALRSDSVTALASCPGGRMYLASLGTIRVYAGGRWADYARVETGAVKGMACGPDGALWITQLDGVSRIEDGEVRRFPARDMAPDARRTAVRGVAAGPGGAAWVTLFGGYVAHYDGASWQAFREGKGFARRHILSAVAVDGEGRPVVGGTRSLLRYKDGIWTAMRKPFGTTSAIAFDARGRIWFGVGGRGLYRLDGAEPVAWSVKSSPLPSNTIRAMAFDGRGRLWLGTAYGVAVLDGKTWTTYQMHNSDLADDSVSALAVIGDGGALPARIDKSKGSFAGKLQWDDGTPIAGGTVEMCTAGAAIVFFRTTSPCAGRKLYAQAITRADGTFAFNEMPSANYRLVVKTEQGWKIVFLGRRGRLAAGVHKRLGVLPIRRRRK